MQKLSQLLLVCGLTASLTASAFAEEKKASNEQSAVKQLTPQTVCPVMGGKIDSTVFTDLQGQRVYHCCPMCSEKLKADPGKYFEKAAAEGVLFENIQKVCPVSGEAIDKAIYSDYKGRRIYFCCKKCQKAFADSPKKYLKKMDSVPAPKQPAEPDHSGHEGHDHHH
ncbi:MAG TPA: YHS domain-containing protein [Candidatus Deferrimicrobium sp.]|nr:YHS domain-containing protein [Candidatus Deferrimicrobium sp.]